MKENSRKLASRANVKEISSWVAFYYISKMHIKSETCNIAKRLDSDAGYITLYIISRC